MRRRFGIVAALAALMVLPLPCAAGQANLEGIWTNATITPLERPAEFAGKAFFTPEEAAAYEKQVRARNNGDRRDVNPEADLAVGYNDFWWDRGTKVVSTLRTALIVDPPD